MRVFQRDIYQLVDRIKRDGYSVVNVEPYVRYISTPDICGSLRIHNLWVQDNAVLVRAGEEVLLRKKIVNPRWVRKVFREYPLPVLFGSLLVPLVLPLIFDERYKFNAHNDAVVAALNTARGIAGCLRENGISVELSELVNDVVMPQDDGVVNLFPKDARVIGR